MTVRLPRLLEFSDALERESRILPRLGPLLPLVVPDVVAIGHPTGTYPASWSVLQWSEGETLENADLREEGPAARRLGEFVRAMRSIDTDGPRSTNQRGRPLAHHDVDVQGSIDALTDEFDPEVLIAAWRLALEAPPWDGVPTWIHADLMPRNIIVAEGEITAVIDFGEASVGNPTYDLIAGWWVFESDARQIFRATIGADDASWQRARGLALGGAAGALAYYKNSNRAFAELARTTINRVIADEDV